MISHRERLEACLTKHTLDRVPIALWRHFPVDDQTSGRQARAHLEFQKTFDFDLVKVTPASSYCLKDWGVQDEWNGATEGTRDYSKHVILNPEDWLKLHVLNPYEGFLGAQLETLRLIFSELGEQTPVIQTIFSPLSQAKNLVGAQNLLIHMRRYPDALHSGLKTITESTQRFIQAVGEMGIAGVFYAVQHAQYGLLNEEEFNIFGARYDLQALTATDDMWLKLLHAHGTNIMFDLLANYPVNMINWHDQETFPSLAEGKNRFAGIVCGGLKREQMVLGTPEQIQTDALAAIEATKGRRFLLGTGCVVPITAPFGNLMAARRIVERTN